MEKYNRIMLEAMSLLLEDYPSMTLTEAAQVIEETAPLLRNIDNDELITATAEELFDEAEDIIASEREYLIAFRGNLTEEDDIRNDEYAMSKVLDLVLARV